MFNLDLFAQPEMNWQKCYGGTQAEGFRRLAITEYNELVFIGSTSSNDGDVSGNHGDGDFWLGMIDSNDGTLLWQRCFGGSVWDYGNAIDLCTDGGFIIGGSTSSSDGDITGLIGSVDFWIVKTDSVGNIDWQKCLGGTSADRLFAIKQTLDGGYIATGQTYSNDVNVSGNHGGIDSWVVKVNSDGEFEWQNCLGGSDDDWGNEISLTNNGYYVLNYTDSNDGDVSGNHGNKDYWIVKLDLSGNIIWQKCLGGSDLDQGNSILTTSDGGCIAIGRTYSNDGDVSNNTGDSDYWLVKLDSLGNLEWEKCFGFDLTYFRDHGQSIFQTSEHGFLMAGYSVRTDPPYTTCYEDWDFWIVKISSDGVMEWEKCLGGLEKDYAYSILEDNYGNVYVGGNTRSNDGDVSGNHGWVDSWLVKLGDFTNIETKEIFQTSSAFPNPTNTTITVVLNNNNRLKELNIYDYSGRLIKSLKCVNPKRVIVDVSEFSKGLYFYKFKNSTTLSGKFIVQ